MTAAQRMHKVALGRTLSPAIALLATFAVGSIAQGQDLGIKAPPQAGPILITGGTVHTVSGESIPNGFVLFDKGIIAAVGAGAGPAEARGAQNVDAKGKHVYPGMIAAETQLGLAEMAAVRATNDYREVGSVTPEVRAAVAVNPDSTLIPVTRSNGVLIAGIYPEGGRIPGRLSVMRMDGWTWEEMAVKADAGLVVSWPNVRPFNAWWMDRSESDQNDEIRRSLQDINDTFKAAESYAAARDADPTLPIDLRWEAMRGVLPKAAKTGGGQLPVFILAQDIDQITSAVTWGLEKGLKMVIVGGRDADMCGDLLKRHDVPVIIGGTHAFPKRSDSPYDDAYTLPARLHAAGVRFCIASADRTAHERNLPYNAATAVAYGLDPAAAIRSVTLWPAQILGVGDQLGSLEVGKAATLIITTGNPLEVTTQIDAAYIDGRKIDLANKQTMLAEKYREKYRQKK